MAAKIGSQLHHHARPAAKGRSSVSCACHRPTSGVAHIDVQQFGLPRAPQHALGQKAVEHGGERVQDSIPSWLEFALLGKKNRPSPKRGRFRKLSQDSASQKILRLGAAARLHRLTRECRCRTAWRPSKSVIVAVDLEGQRVGLTRGVRADCSTPAPVRRETLFGHEDAEVRLILVPKREKTDFECMVIR